MLLKLPVFVVLLYFIEFGQSTENRRFRICVPESFFEDCQNMTSELADKKGQIDCVYANDKIGCIEKVARDDADFLPLDPEEIYVANQFSKSAFRVISEIRTTEFRDRDYRYEPVAIIRNSAQIKSISDLKGKRSCHTGFGRNAGWKVPFSHLMDKNEISKYCDGINATIIEKDMYAFSHYFGSACAPGKWVPEDQLDRSLKQKYSQLCKLCKFSDCSDKDGAGYIGYTGALMCLTQNNGDVAWTKMDAVVKYFQLDMGKGIPIASDYSFLCWDGSSVPLISGSPCSWAKRPWQAIIATTRPILISDLREQLSLYEKTSTEQSSKWRKRVLEIDSDSELYHYPENYKKTDSPTKYLGYGNYTVTIQKPSCPSKNIRICVESGFAQQKCEGLRMASTGRRITPTFECILSDKNDCLDFINGDKADVMFTEAKIANRASKIGMTSILSELETIQFNSTQNGPFRYAIAVVRTNSNITNLKDLQGKKSCHGSISSLAGWDIPLVVLRDNKLIFGGDCELPLALSKFFNATCVPGALDKSLNMPWLPNSLCQLCSSGNGSDTPNTICINNEDELYYGNKGALKCLKDNLADVAFVDHVVLNTKSFEKEIGIKSNEIRLLCPSGGRQEYTEFHNCNWGKIPTRKVIAKNGDSNTVVRENARIALLKASDLFRPGSKYESVFRLFSPYYGNSDLLFLDTSVGLTDDTKSSVIYPDIKQDSEYCTASSGEKLITCTKITVLIYVVVQFVLR